ncbi:MAG TPA: hypothetical protein VM364_02910 [Vicinamibacterales bacterium]|nr:hypothetical protein [Vicinamibacterales bacterium]
MFVHPPRALAVVLLILGAAAALAAQKPAAAPPEPVAVDFYALGPDGPVFDLRRDEVTLKIDGRTRKVRALRYVGLPLADASLPGEEPPELDPPFGTNLPDVAGRWVSIIVDHESIRPGTERDALGAVIRLVNNLGARDRVSLVTMPNGGVEIDFTEKHEQVADALRKFIGRAPRESTVQERSCRSRLLLNSMSDYIGGLADFEGPKAIVLVSSGMLNPRRDAPMTGPPGPCEIRMIYFQEVSRAASRARASMYVVQPDDVTMDPAKQVFVDRTLSRFAGSDEDRAGLESLAGVTGGEFMRIIGPDDNTLLQLVRASSGYYIATFEPEPGERNGAPHRVDISVARDRVRIRTRPEVFIPRPVTTKAAHASVTEMLRNGILYRALPLRTTAYPSLGENGKVKILAVVEGVEPDVKITEAVFGLIDSRDRLIARWTADARELASAPIVTAGEAVPGAYRLRVAAIDASGRRGTAEYDLVARLTDADPLSLSGLALGVSRDGAFTPKLVFGTDQAAVSYFEVYGRAPGDGVSVRLEVAAVPDGRALTTAAARVLPQGDRRLVVGALPIASLAPGEYVVRAIVSLEGRPVGRITRTLRKSPS